MTTRGCDRNGFGRLHVLTDATGPRPVLDVVDAALGAGTPVIQVRAKSGTDRDRLAQIDAVVARCRTHGASCIVNDRADLALAAGAAGVHLGDDDLSVAAVRAFAPTLLIGATVRTPDAARAAQRDGADYVGIGPVFVTETKAVAVQPLGVDRAAEIAAAVDIASVGIAGVDPTTAGDLVGRGLTGVAVVTAVSRADDPAAACVDLLDTIEAAT